MVVPVEIADAGGLAPAREIQLSANDAAAAFAIHDRQRRGREPGIAIGVIAPCGALHLPATFRSGLEAANTVKRTVYADELRVMTRDRQVRERRPGACLKIKRVVGGGWPGNAAIFGNKPARKVDAASMEAGIDFLNGEWQRWTIAPATRRLRLFASRRPRGATCGKARAAARAEA